MSARYGGARRGSYASRPADDRLDRLRRRQARAARACTLLLALIIAATLWQLAVAR